MQSSGIQLSKETNEALIDSIQKFFLVNRDEEMSRFQASLFLDFILAEAGVYIYNQGIADAHQLMNEKTEEIFSLEKRITTFRDKTSL
jgi:uncharacterized protein (DUF2164 family)